MTTDITELALIKGQKVEAPYYLAECTECGKMYSSSKLIVSRNYFDGDADCYCPHCNADDADIADLGSSEQPAAMAWNYQQARIDALVEALESEKRICSTWRKTAESTGEKLQKAEKTSEARREAIGRTHNMFVRERDRANAAEEALEKAQETIAFQQGEIKALLSSLESRTVKLPQRLQPGADGYDDWYVHSDDDGEYLKVDDVLAMLTDAGIKVEAE